MANKSFVATIEELCQRDRDLANIVETYGYPSQWQRKP